MRPLALPVLLTVLLVLAAVPAAGQESCDVPSVRGANPAPAVLAHELEAAATRHEVPAALLKAIAFVEGTTPAPAGPDGRPPTRVGVQFDYEGAPITSTACAVGVLQVRPRDDLDLEEVAADWRANVEEGARLLAEKMADAHRSDEAAGLPPADPVYLENWWAAAYRYNGQGDEATAYADRVFRALSAETAGAEALQEAALDTPVLPTLRTPNDLFAEYDPAEHQTYVTADEAVLTSADGEELRRIAFTPTPVPSVEVLPPTPRAAGDERAPVEAAVALSRHVFADAGTPTADGPTARYALLARDDDWPDALAGAALTGDGQGAVAPLLYAGGGPAGTLPATTAGELDRSLETGATVYLLGGEAALSPAVERAVEELDLRPQRLAGLSRLETALQVAREAVRRGAGDRPLLVARGYVSPADALTGGAAAAILGRALVLVPDDPSAAPAEEIAGLGPRQATVLGGTAAVPQPVADRLAAAGLTVDRRSGATRHDTAAAVGRLVPAVPDVLAVDLATVDRTGPSTTPESRGWAWALAAAPLAADLRAPQLGMNPDGVPEVTAAALDERAATRAIVVGSGMRIGTGPRQKLRDLLAR